LNAEHQAERLWIPVAIFYFPDW